MISSPDTTPGFLNGSFYDIIPARYKEGETSIYSKSFMEINKSLIFIHCIMQSSFKTDLVYCKFCEAIKKDITLCS